MKLIYLLLSFLNFRASLRVAASSQAKEGLLLPSPWALLSQHQLAPRMILNTLTNAKWLYFQIYDCDSNPGLFAKRFFGSIYLLNRPF